MKWLWYFIFARFILNVFFCYEIYSLYKLDLLKYALQIKPGYKNINKELFSDKDILICVNTFIVGNKVFDNYHSYFEGENFDDNYKCSWCYL